MNKKKDDFFLSFKEIYRYDKKLLFIMIADVIIEAIVPFPNIIITGLIVDSLVYNRPVKEVMIYIATMFIFDFGTASLHTLFSKISEYRVIQFVNYLNNEINKKCMNIDYEQFNDSSFQERMHFVCTAAQGNIYINNLTSALNSISQLLTLVGVVIIITAINVWLILISAILVVLQSYLYSLKLRYNRKYNVETINDRRKVSYVTQIVRNIEFKKDIQLFGMESYIFSKITSFYKSLLSFDRERIIASGFVELITNLLSVVFKISAYVILGIETYQGVITIGEFTKCTAALLSFMTVSTYLMMNILDYSNGIFYIYKIKSFLRIKSKYDYIRHQIKINQIDLRNIRIEFRNVSFRYPNSTNYVLKNINISIDNMEKLGIVGCNGAGKTTFVLLLTRMYDPTEGNIFLNGINIRDIDYREYMKLFSSVFQDFTLNAFSILDNISCSTTNEKKDIITKLINENGLERVQSFYRGVDTPITKELEASGVDLSGGERQKVAIVRALFKDAPILILDEPSSALDPIAEQNLYNNFSKMSHGKTTVYISHRIYSTRFCDKIAVFKDGQIIEYGSFNELIKNKGIYFKLYNQQTSFILQ